MQLKESEGAELHSIAKRCEIELRFALNQSFLRMKDRLNEKCLIKGKPDEALSIL